jgi:hypothetical protein
VKSGFPAAATYAVFSFVGWALPTNNGTNTHWR